jgi:hypothetical protein
MWQQGFEAISDPESPHYHTGMAAMAEYAQGSFILQQSTKMTVQQRLCMVAHDERHTVGARTAEV